jgi:hypothetical protein
MPAFDNIVIIWRKGTVDDPYVSMNDTLSIVNGKTVLNEIPDEFNHVVVPSYVEIRSGIPEPNQFVVNYQTGVLTFNQSENGKTVTASYMGRGVLQIPASRVTYFDTNNNIWNDIQNLISSGQDGIQALGQLQPAIDNANSAVINANQAVSDANSAVDLANTAATAANTAAQNANNATTVANTSAQNANTATQNADDAAINANATNQSLLNTNININFKFSNMKNMGEYNQNATYYNGNIITYNGSSYMLEYGNQSGLSSVSPNGVVTGQPFTPSSTSNANIADGDANTFSIVSATVSEYLEFIPYITANKLSIIYAYSPIRGQSSTSVIYADFYLNGSVIKSLNTMVSSGSGTIYLDTGVQTSFDKVVIWANNSTAIYETKVYSETSPWVSIAQKGDKGDIGQTGRAGLNWTGPYNSTTQYVIGDGVIFNGSAYICIAVDRTSQYIVGFDPTFTDYWSILVQKGDNGAISSVTSASNLITVNTNAGNASLDIVTGTGPSQIPVRDANGDIELGLSGNMIYTNSVVGTNGKNSLLSWA